MDKPKNSLAHLFDFKRIENKEEGISLLRDIGKGCYFLGVLHIVLSLIAHTQSFLMDGILFLMLGHGISLYQSRTASILLCIDTFAGIYFTFDSKIHNGSGGRNVILALMMFVYSIRAVQVSFQYQALVNSRPVLKNIIIKTTLSFVYSLIFIVLGIISVVVIFGNTEKVTENAWGMAVILPLCIGTFLTFRGWLPFTKNKPMCAVSDNAV